MASKTLGRVACPIGCGHTAAQVKLKTDKGADKTAYPYVHCAGCGVQLHTRSEDQAKHLLAVTRAEKGAEGPPSVPKPSDDPEAQPEPKKAPTGFLSGFLMGATS